MLVAHSFAQRIWTKAQDISQIILRSLRLTLITHAFVTIRHPLGRGLHERTKTAVDANRAIAILRSLIHVVPVSAALAEIILNWNTYYVGTKEYNQALYQLIAKAHEIMIQASIAAVVFSCIRSEMIDGNGIPFGLLFSGLQVAQVSYLWSREFWGSLFSNDIRRFRKIGIIAVVSMGTLLATASGPSSAVLLIPRLQFWPAGKTHIWINATQEEIWPNRSDNKMTPSFM